MIFTTSSTSKQTVHQQTCTQRNDVLQFENPGSAQVMETIQPSSDTGLIYLLQFQKEEIPPEGMKNTLLQAKR